MTSKGYTTKKLGSDWFILDDDGQEIARFNGVYQLASQGHVDEKTLMKDVLEAVTKRISGPQPYDSALDVPHPFYDQLPASFKTVEEKNQAITKARQENNQDLADFIDEQMVVGSINAPLSFLVKPVWNHSDGSENDIHLHKTFEFLKEAFQYAHECSNHNEDQTFMIVSQYSDPRFSKIEYFVWGMHFSKWMTEGDEFSEFCLSEHQQKINSLEEAK